MNTNEQGKSPPPERPILVLGVGNILMRDEGIGVRVIEAMQRLDLPDTVEVLDGGTGSLDLLEVMARRQKVIIVDAVQGGAEPGAIYRLRPADLAGVGGGSISVHELGIEQNLVLMSLLGDQPGEVVIIGIEPKVVAWGTDLSAEMREAIPKAIDVVLREIQPSRRKDTLPD